MLEAQDRRAGGQAALGHGHRRLGPEHRRGAGRYAVHVKDEKTSKSVKYTIVGSAEADPSETKLSNESPVGKALLGHKRGEMVEVAVPRGPKRKLKITKIEV